MSLKEAAVDPHIRAVMVEPAGLASGWAKLEELRRDLEQFRKSGKPVFAYLRAPNARDYYVALAADRIYMGPQEPLMLKGLRAEIMYFKKTLDKLGVTCRCRACRKVQRLRRHVHAVRHEPGDPRSDARRWSTTIYGNLIARIADGPQEIARGSAGDRRSRPVHGARSLESGAGGRLAFRRPDVGRTAGPLEAARRAGQGLDSPSTRRFRRKTSGSRGRARSPW